MAGPPLMLADQARAEQFHLLGRARRLFEGYETWADADGVVWARKRVGGHCFAATWLGPGWVFDPVAQQRRAKKLAERRRAVREADADRHRRELDAALHRLRVGPHAERLLWAIHRRVIGARASAVRIPDREFGAAVWGHDASTWPRNWRQSLLSVLESLTWLHVAESSDTHEPQFGAATALLTHVGDLRKNPEADICDDDCLMRHARAHHHYLVNIGQGFLGVLEQFAKPDEEPGVRTYQFAVGGRRDDGVTLRTVGKTGRLVSVFLPAKLGEPAACAALNARQHRLLQAIVRELTRRTKKNSRDQAEPEVITDGRVRGITGKRWRSCPCLSATACYVSFGGNGKRKGRGYLLTTPGGWLAKAGHPLGDVRTFLSDLQVLADLLGLVVVGLHRRNHQWYSLERMVALAAAPVGCEELQQLHVRIHAGADFARQWSERFGVEESAAAVGKAADFPTVALIDSMTRKKIRRRALAFALDLDPSFLTKLLNGKKSWPEGLLERAQGWVADYEFVATQNVEAPPQDGEPADSPIRAITTVECEPLLAVARDYLRRGWSVVPQRPGAKTPYVKWKPFQERRPTDEELQDWFRQWPDAGLAVVLGPVSNLFVVDVDGPEAHAVLIDHLGSDPVAPKALSGSRKPHRYHLFFRWSAATKAKATPWHSKLEFRGKGGIIVLPPSLHKSGHCYAWADGRTPDSIPLPELPAEIVAALTPVPRSTPAGPLQTVVEGVEFSPSTQKFLAGEFADGPGWNHRLFRAGCDLAGRGLPLEEAEPLLLAGARPYNQTEEENARRTVQSAYSQAREPARY